MPAASKRGLYASRSKSNLALYNSIVSRKKATRKKTVALSDVDGTLVRGSLVLQHATILHNSGVVDLGDLPGKWMLDVKNEEAITALAVSYQKAITGMRVEDLGVNQFLDKLCENSENFYSPLNRLASQSMSGNDVVLISGSPSFLVENFGKRYGFTAQASNYHTNSDGFLTGGIDGMFSAPAKKAYVESLDLSQYSEIQGFGDTSSDVPLFEAANYAVLVAPNERTRSMIGHSVDEIVED